MSMETETTNRTNDSDGTAARALPTKLEKWLLPVAFAIALALDRLVFGFNADDSLLWRWGAFWLMFLGIFCILHREKFRRNKVLWFVSACCAALCAWSFFFDGHGNEGFAMLNFLVIPCALMGLTQYAAGDFRLKDAGGLAAAWFFGWLIRPFSGLAAFGRGLASLFVGNSRSTAKKAGVGILAALLLLCVIVPLLSGADKVFGYYVNRITNGFDAGSLVGHGIATLILFALFYSFLWNSLFAGKDGMPSTAVNTKIDAVTSRIVIGAALAVYALFCVLQFTYLFAGAGLPMDMTYSEYAREGFWQTIAVCSINLIIFGIFVRFGDKAKGHSALLLSLLGLTAVMLFSGFTRLRLYIDAYGLTYLRILSAWFIIFLAAVIVLCAARVFRENIPAVAVAALILLGWFAVLGYSDPYKLEQRHNAAFEQTYSDFSPKEDYNGDFERIRHYP